MMGKVTMDVVGSEIINGKEKDILVRNYSKTYAIIILQCIAILFSYIELYLIHRLTKPKTVRAFVIKSILLFFSIYIFQSLSLGLFFYLRDELDVLNNINFTASVFFNIFYIAVVVLYGFTKKWIRHERDKQQLELVKNQAELNLLRRQLQPHFLFNTLNNLMAMVNQTDNPKLAQGIDKLSGLLRHVVYNTDVQDQLTVAQEIEFIRNFSELHLLRFEENEIDFKLNVTGEYTSQPLEPGIFLCYVENAFKHGLQPEEQGFIYIEIDVSDRSTINFSVENSIPKRPLEKKEGGFGIKSNQDRLDLAYPDRYSIVFNEDVTYNVELTIKTHD